MKTALNYTCCKNDFDIEIIVGKKTYSSDYEKMGFADERKDQRKNTLPIRAWNMLINFANEGGKYPIDNSPKQKAIQQKQKEEICRKLKLKFPNIEEKFIEINQDNTEYIANFNLIPPPYLRNNYEDHMKGISDTPKEFLPSIK